MGRNLEVFSISDRKHLKVSLITDKNYPKVFSILNTLKNIMVKYIWIIKRDVERARNKGEPITYRKTS